MAHAIMTNARKEARVFSHLRAIRRKRLIAPEVDVGRRDVAEALLVAAVVVILDGATDRPGLQSGGLFNGIDL